MEWEDLIRRSTLLPELRSASLGYDTKLTPGWIAQRTVARLDGKADPVDATFKTRWPRYSQSSKMGHPNEPARSQSQTGPIG